MTDREDFYNRIQERANEAIAADEVIPFKIVPPPEPDDAHSVVNTVVDTVVEHAQHQESETLQDEPDPVVPLFDSIAASNEIQAEEDAEAFQIIVEEAEKPVEKIAAAPRSDAIRIFIGTEAKTRIAEQVLMHSIRKNTKAEVVFTPMIGPGWEYPLDGIKVGTGFSLRRWMIPAACGFQGRAIYMDADQLVFGNVAELWDYPNKGPASGVIWCTHQKDKFSDKPWPQTSVMVIDCAKAKDHWGFDLDKLLFHLRKRATQKDYANLMHATWLTSQQIGSIPTFWNHLNEFHEGKTRLLHYTKEDAQPWYKPDHPLADLWRKALVDAIKDDVVDRRHFADALEKWDVKEDWRSTNGLHPIYRKYLPLF